MRGGDEGVWDGSFWVIYSPNTTVCASSIVRILLFRIEGNIRGKGRGGLGGEYAEKHFFPRRLRDFGFHQISMLLLEPAI